MMRVPSLRLVRTAIVAAAAISAFVFTASAARAECGDYVIVGQPRLNSNDLRPELVLKIALQSVYSHDGPTDHRGSAPCHGPSCSGRDPVPGPSAPTAVLTTNTTDWAVLATGMSSSEFKPERFFPQPILQIPERLPTPVEDPPRAV